MSLGFQRAGFSIMSAFDSWQPAVETYRQNFDHPIELQELNSETSLPNADIIIGGPPCQGFSSAGMRKKGDERNTLVSVFSELVLKSMPKVFVFENVEGLT